MLYTVAMLAAIIFPQYKEIATTGSYNVETALYTWTDESRVETYTDTGEKRKVTVEFFYPDREGKYPLVVFSHGAASVIESNFSTCRELASNGYVVAAVAHHYHAIFVEDADGNTTTIDMEFMSAATGGIMSLSKVETLELYKEWMKIRAHDVNFALDTMLSYASEGKAGAFGLIDRDHIGLLGHSLGGATMAAVGRQRDDIDAVIVLEGTMLGEYISCDGDRFIYNDEPYPLPLLDVNSDSLCKIVAEDYSEDYQYVNFYVVEKGIDSREVTFDNAAHMNFCDLPLISPPLASLFGVGKRGARECIETVNSMVLEYFDYYLKASGELNIQDKY